MDAEGTAFPMRPATQRAAWASAEVGGLPPAVFWGQVKDKERDRRSVEGR